ncbi:hypothetical protein KKG15_01835 [Patescibacteria group bacterium]|nr:hypothetical protein [Patescibacteria group bacterium]
MNEFLLGLEIGGIFLGIIAVVAGIITTISILAKHNLFWTFVEEGTARAIMKFDGFHKFVMQYENCKLDEKTWDISVCGPDEPKERSLFGGLKWVGIPGIKSVYQYRFTWATVKAQKEEREQVERRTEMIKHIFVKDYVYLGEIKGAETKSLVPLDIDFLITTRVINPYKSLFRVHDWVNVVTSRIEAYFRQFVSLLEYEELISRKQQMGGEIMKALGETGMLESDEELPDGEIKHHPGKFLEDYGIKVKNIEMRDIEPVGENKKIIQEAATKKWVAGKQYDQVLILADAEIERIGRVYTKIKSFGEEGLAIRTLESIDKAGEKQGNWIIPFGSIKDMISGFLGKR